MSRTCPRFLLSSYEADFLFIFPPRVCLHRTLDDGVYKIAVSLAKRYSVPLWEVYMTHLEFLFTDSGYMHKHTLCVLNTADIYPSAAILPLYTVVATATEQFFLPQERANQPLCT